MDEEIRSQREEDENAARDQQTPVRRRRSRLYDPANLPEAANAPEGKESRTQAEMRERRLAPREEPEKREEMMEKYDPKLLISKDGVDGYFTFMYEYLKKSDDPSLGKISNNSVLCVVIINCPVISSFIDNIIFFINKS